MDSFARPLVMSPRGLSVVTLIPKQRQRRMTDLLNRAEIQAVMVPTRVGDPHLDNLV